MAGGGSLLDYPSGSNVTIKVLINERGRIREGDETTEAGLEKCCVADFEEEGRGP